MKAAAMDPDRLSEIRRRITSRINCLNVVSDYIRELLADRDHQAARNAAVIEVMKRMDDARRKDASECNARVDERSYFCDGGATRLTYAIEALRQALELPSEWRDTCPRCGSGEGVCELWCDLEDGGEG